MGSHIIDGQFQSDKYPETPRGLVPLKPTDPTAQDLLWLYAQRRRVVDAEFADDLEQVLRSAGYSPPEPQFILLPEDPDDDLDMEMLSSSNIDDAEREACRRVLFEGQWRGLDQPTSDLLKGHGVVTVGQLLPLRVIEDGPLARGVHDEMVKKEEEDARRRKELSDREGKELYLRLKKRFEPDAAE